MYADRALSDPQSGARVQRQIARARELQSRRNPADQALTTTLALARQRSALYEIGLTALLPAHLIDDERDHASAAVVLAELGVRTVPASFQRLDVAPPRAATRSCSTSGPL